MVPAAAYRIGKWLRDAEFRNGIQYLCVFFDDGVHEYIRTGGPDADAGYAAL